MMRDKIVPLMTYPEEINHKEPAILKPYTLVTQNSLVLSAFLAGCFSLSLVAQKAMIPADTLVITRHNTVIKGAQITYTAKTGTQPVRDEQGTPIAALFYTFYERTNVDNPKNRPIVFSFNGGPGSASVWMHLAYTGPYKLNIDDEGYPIQPYGFEKNPFSILDVADIVFINPVNTAYSRKIDRGEATTSDEFFFGINQDISYLAEWLSNFVARNERWASPKYLIGESYGGTRVMGLALELQNRQWMYLNGVVLVSPADYKVLRRGGPVSSALNLPYYAAAAWYHGQLTAELQQLDLLQVLPQVEIFTTDELIPALAKGGFITAERKKEIAEKMAYYSGLDETEILQHNLDVPNYFFWKALLRQQGKTIGRLDSRYIGIDKKDSGVRPDYNAELTSWLHAFTPAINMYIKDVLNFSTEVKYNMFGKVNPWNKEHDNTRDNLRQAMAQNPFLHVLIQSGYYDGATTYFNAKYTMWQIDPSGKMKDRFFFEGYRSGHMMYLRKDDLIKANDDLRDFIILTNTTGSPANYTQKALFYEP